jgi:hypothetical protein
MKNLYLFPNQITNYETPMIASNTFLSVSEKSKTQMKMVWVYHPTIIKKISTDENKN